MGIIWPFVLWNDQREPESIDFVCLIVCNFFIKKVCYGSILQNINMYNVIGFNFNFSC